MKILQLSQFFPPVLGGEERHVLNLSRALSEHHDVVVATYGAEDTVDHVDGLTVHRIRPLTSRLPGVYQGERQHAPPLPDPMVVRALARLIDLHRPDIIHAHNWIVHSLLPLRRRTAAPFVLTLHDYSNVCSIKRLMYRDRSLCPGPAPHRCLPCASQHYRGIVGPVTYFGLLASRWWKSGALDHVLAVSRAVAEGNRLADFGVPWDVVPNFVADGLGSDPTDLPRPGWVPEGDYWLFAGDLSSDKGVPVLLAAYASLPQTRPPLLLVGRQADYVPRHLPAGALIAGPRPHEEMPAVFAGARLVTAPSVWPDPCPTVVLEAMAHGVPVVTTAIGGMVDMVRDEVDGRLVRPGDPNALADALWKLHTTPAAARAMGEAARKRVDDFRSGHVVARIADLYHRLVGLRDSGPARSEGGSA